MNIENFDLNPKFIVESDRILCYTVAREAKCMELRVLQYFLAVCREQSISSAAESLHLSQPTLSTQLKALEEELGKQLLIRGTKGSRKVLLTEEGMILRKRRRKSSSWSG